jgi:hypothetical protein
MAIKRVDAPLLLQLLRRGRELEVAAAVQARQRREYERIQREAELAANATEQTRRRLKRDAIAELWADGKLRREQVRAANEIHKVFEAITSEGGARVHRYDGIPREGGTDTRDWPPTLRRAYSERYVPWRDEAARQAVGRGTAVSVVLCVAVDNCGYDQAARKIGVHHKTALRVLRESLYRYGELAGWYETVY